jgi:hypothetical protein
MDLVFIVFPLSSIALARTIVRKSCFEDSIQFPFRWSLSFWTLCSAFLGFTGYDVYQVNDQTATTAFLALCWLLGNGYVITNSFCNPYANIVYCLLLIVVASALYERMHSLGKFLGRDTIVPMLIWSTFLLVTSAMSVPALKST